MKHQWFKESKKQSKAIKVINFYKFKIIEGTRYKNYKLTKDIYLYFWWHIPYKITIKIL